MRLVARVSASTRRVRWGRLIALCTVFALLGIGPVPAADAEPVLPDPPASLGVSQRATIAILYWPSVDGAEGYAVDVAARWLGLAQTPELLRDVQLMERESLAIMAERR